MEQTQPDEVGQTLRIPITPPADPAPRQDEATKAKSKRKSVPDQNFEVFEGIRVSQACLDQQRWAPSTAWTAPEATKWFAFCKAAVNERDVLERLTLMVWFHRNTQQYVVQRLGRTRDLWADCYKAWEFTAGFVYSSVAEHWFRSITSHLKKQQVPLTGVIGMMREVAEKRERVTYDRQGEHAVLSTIPKLKMILSEQGLEDVVKLISEYVLGGRESLTVEGRSQRQSGDCTLAALLDVIREALEYKVIGEYESLSEEAFKLAKYSEPDASGYLFTRVLSGRINVEVSDVLFDSHEQPPRQEQPYARKLFAVGRKSSSGRAHLIFYCDGALLCDCSNFQQFGRWCKHCFSLVASGLIDFNPALAIDAVYACPQYRKEGSFTFPPVTLKGATRAIPVTFKWTWGKSMLGDKPQAEREAASFERTIPTEQRQAIRRETENKRLRRQFDEVVKTALAKPELVALLDDLFDVFHERAQELSGFAPVNAGAKLRNPLPGDRRKMELNRNKSYGYAVRD
jgi:hypothetical protein